MATDYEEFIKFHKLLMKNAPEGYTPFYFKCASNGKEPYLKAGSWKKAGISYEEALEWLKHGGNVGIAGTDEDCLVPVDIDDEDITDYTKLKPTLTIRSGGRMGVHLFYWESIPGLIPNVPTDTAGEVRANWQYVIAPGSYVEQSEERKEKLNDKERGLAGKYTIEIAIPPSFISLDDLPQIFKDQIEKNRVAEQQQRIRNDEAKARTNGIPAEHSKLFDLTIYDIVGNTLDPSKRFPSLFHGSDTGKNTSISNGLLHCWRHNVSLNALQALCVLSNYMTCEEAGSPHKEGGASKSMVTDNDRAIWEAWKYAKAKKLIPADDPIPLKALKHVAVLNKFCKATDIKDGWKIPTEAYSRAIESIELQGVDPGRKIKKEVKVKARKTRSKENEEIQFDPKTYAEIIMEKYNFLTLNDTNEILFYNGGSYHFKGDQVINSEMVAELGEDYRSFYTREVEEYIRGMTYVDRKIFSSPDARYVNMQNGVFDLLEAKLIEHDPKFYFLTELPVAYDPKANCPQIDKFLSEVLDHDDIPVIFEIVGYCLYRSYPIQKAVMFIGEGSNGKSTLAKLIKTFLGSENCTAHQLQDFDRFRFAAADLYQKLANISSDIPAMAMKQTGIFKMLTGGDPLMLKKNSKLRLSLRTMQS